MKNLKKNEKSLPQLLPRRSNPKQDPHWMTRKKKMLNRSRINLTFTPRMTRILPIIKPFTLRSRESTNQKKLYTNSRSKGNPTKIWMQKQSLNPMWKGAVDRASNNTTAGNSLAVITVIKYSNSATKLLKPPRDKEFRICKVTTSAETGLLSQRRRDKTSSRLR